MEQLKKKTVVMTCQPCRMVGRHLETACSKWVTGKGLSYRVRKMERVQ